MPPQQYIIDTPGGTCQEQMGEEWSGPKSAIVGRRRTTGVQSSAQVQNVPHRAVGKNMRMDAILLV